MAYCHMHSGSLSVRDESFMHNMMTAVMLLADAPIQAHTFCSRFRFHALGVTLCVAIKSPLRMARLPPTEEKKND